MRIERTGTLALWLLGVIWLLGACATQGEPVSSPVERAAGGPSWPLEALENVLKVGYVSISERYIDPLSLSDVAMHSLDGLGDLDPALTVKREDGVITLTKGGRTVTRFPVPSGEDPDGWARLGAAAVAALRTASDSIRRTDPEHIYEAMFGAILSRLDDHSRYTGREEAEKLRLQRNGFGGIGLSFRIEPAGLKVTRVFPDLPAADAGITPGDLIYRIDGEDLSGLSRSQIERRLRGVLNAPIRLGLIKVGSERRHDVELLRDRVFLPTVRAQHRGGIVHLRISGFNRGTTHALVESMSRASQRGLTGVILDLRGNPGGVFEQAVEVSDLFLEGGRIVSSYGRHPESLQDYLAHPGGFDHDLPVVVLIDGRTASAAEILAAALQDAERGVIVGTSSFGKGTIQNVLQLPNDGEITLTWARFVAPSGYDLNHTGVLPNICLSGKPKGQRIKIDESWLRRSGGRALTRLARWRKSGEAAAAQRKDLKISCAGQHRPGRADLVVARHIINNRTLYHFLLGRGASLSARLAGPETPP